jgi:hypothetical protein
LGAVEAICRAAEVQRFRNREKCFQQPTIDHFDALSGSKIKFIRLNGIKRLWRNNGHCCDREKLSDGYRYGV